MPFGGGALLVRGSIPASCILGITEVYPDSRGNLKESAVWNAGVRHCVPWCVVKADRNNRPLAWDYFPDQPTAPAFTRGTPGSADSNAPTIQQYGTDPSTIAANFIGSTLAKTALDLRVFRCPHCAPPGPRGRPRYLYSGQRDGATSV